MAGSRFVVARTIAGWHFVLRGRNGRVVLQSEVYRSRSAALKGVAAIKRTAVEATVVHVDHRTKERA